MAEVWWSSLDDCTKTEWGGHNAWCNPPFHLVEPVLHRFLDCKRRSPTNTSATFVVPAWVGASWWQTLEENFLFVRYYPPWSTIFTASPVKGTDARRLMGPVRWPVIIAVCQAGPLKSFPNRDPIEAELSPERLKQAIKDLEEKPAGDEPDPLTLIKFGPDLSPEQRNQIIDVLRPFGRKLWALSNADLAVPINVIEHHIHCTDTAPIVRKGAPKSHVENEALGKWAMEGLSWGLLSRSVSLNSAPSVVVLKKPEPGDSAPPEIRVCFNYRGRNEKTHGDDTACPEVMPTLQALQGSQWFGSADGKSAFHQIAMAHDSRGYTAFNIRGKGSFEFVRMPFGLKTAPATFIRAMDMILEGSKRLHSFIDDIKHGAPDFEGHLQDVADLASRCILHNLRLSPKKFMVGFKSLCALGYVADADGLHPDPAKVEAITGIIQPVDTTGLRSFLGMVNFYGPLIPNLSALTSPLHALTARGKSVVHDWTEEHTQAFEALKAALAAAPGLAYPDLEKRFKVTTDWQPGHMAAILSQQWVTESGEETDRPLHFLAKKLVGYEASWPATTGEQACAVWAIRKLHAYLFGVEFDLVTDHKALVAMLQCQETTGKLARWNVDLFPYTFMVHHKAGKELANADGLSRTDKEIRAEAVHLSRITAPEVSAVRSTNEDQLAKPGNSLAQTQDTDGTVSPTVQPEGNVSVVETLSAPVTPTGHPGWDDWSSTQLRPPAEIHPTLWEAFMKEMSIESRGAVYYPCLIFQEHFAKEILVAAYPFTELASSELPDNWGLRIPGRYGQGVFLDLRGAFLEDISRYLEGGRPYDQHGNHLYCGQTQDFWVKVMGLLRYWRAQEDDPFESLLLGWEIMGNSTADAYDAPPAPPPVDSCIPSGLPRVFTIQSAIPLDRTDPLSFSKEGNEGAGPSSAAPAAPVLESLPPDPPMQPEPWLHAQGEPVPAQAPGSPLDSSPMSETEAPEDASELQASPAIEKEQGSDMETIPSRLLVCGALL